MKWKPIKQIIWTILLTGCIGVDTLDDPIVDPTLEIIPGEAAISIAETVSFSGTYKNQYGVSEAVDFTWSVDNPAIAEVSILGVVTGIAAGQTLIRISAEGLEAAAQLTVVDNADAVANVQLTAPRTELMTGEQVQLTTSVTNLAGTELIGRVLTFSSSDEAVLTVSSTGLVSAVALGTASVTVEVEGVSSLPLTFVVGADFLTGTFQGSGGYTAEGTATLMRNSSDELILTFSDDFRTSFALGTFVYMANSTSGSTVRSQGLELGEITSNGAKTFNISAIESTATLTTYQYVIILCKPASLTFGSAKLE